MSTEMNEGGSPAERKRIDSLYWGIVIIWAGLVFGAESLDYLPQIGEAEAWSWVFLGAGVFSLAGSLYRMVSGSTSSPTTWDWVWGGIFLIIGISGFTAMDISWPLILVFAGVVMLVRALTNRD